MIFVVGCCFGGSVWGVMGTVGCEHWFFDKRYIFFVVGVGFVDSVDL